MARSNSHNRHLQRNNQQPSNRLNIPAAAADWPAKKMVKQRAIFLVNRNILIFEEVIDSGGWFISNPMADRMLWLRVAFWSMVIARGLSFSLAGFRLRFIIFSLARLDR